MKGDELDAYQNLSVERKNMVDALKKLGFTYKYFSTWEKSGFARIDIEKIDGLSDLISKVFQEGKNRKLWEIQDLLGIM